MFKLCSWMMVVMMCRSLSCSDHICSLHLHPSILILCHCEETHLYCVYISCHLYSSLCCLGSCLCILCHFLQESDHGSCVYPDCISSLTWDCMVARVTCCSVTSLLSVVTVQSLQVVLVSWCSSCLVTSSLEVLASYQGG